MYLILEPISKRIMHFSKTLDYNSVGGFVLDSGLHIAKGISEAVEVKEIPSHVEVEKYCYINNEFVYNIDYVEEINEEISEEISEEITEEITEEINEDETI